VIGWKDGREARRAIQDALPFLHEATKVTVVEICKSGEESTAQKQIDDVVRYFTRHRINANPRVVLLQQGSGAAELIKFAQEDGADAENSAVDGGVVVARLFMAVIMHGGPGLMYLTPLADFLTNLHHEPERTGVRNGVDEMTKPMGKSDLAPFRHYED
jgi:hypothetical protein